ncbi:hypothetical protein MHH52_23800 [Paenibacillus sp. FSL K6-0276]|uniref:hypothetical protein n=1 Tax=Paenibacillus sp. FSL K6-0276 TaxID=2921450 RepID=UPI0030EF89D3
MKRTIVCFGDSNTWGYDAETDQRFNDEIRWTGLLHTELDDAYHVIEEGLPGRTSVSEDPLFEGVALTSYNIAQGIVRLALKARGSGAGPAGKAPEVLVNAPPPMGQIVILGRA